MKETILHQIGDFVRSILQWIPLEFVRFLFLGLIAAVLIIVLRRPKTETTPDKPGKSRWDENLKIWAALALVLQLLIYWFL
jgi:hypothetical protein